MTTKAACSCLTPKLKPMDPTFLNLYLTSTMMKNDGKSRQFSIIENEAQDTNITSNGKAMMLWKQRGNLPCVSRTAEKKFSESIASSKTSTLLKELST